MSQVKFEERRETVRTTNAAPSPRAGVAPPPPAQKEDLAHEIGNALTQGAGPNGYLAVRSLSYIWESHSVRHGQIYGQILIA
jgi:hypothetical protein